MAEIQASFQNHATDDALSAEKVSTALCEAGFNPTNEQIDEFFKEHEKEEGSHMTLEEFQLLAESMGNPDDELRGAFRTLAGHDGIIDRSELEKILSDMHKEETDDTLQTMITELIDKYDQNNDGKLNINEFIAAVNGSDITVPSSE